jgi:archaetidylinositol phosphate synthase
MLEKYMRDSLQRGCVDPVAQRVSFVSPTQLTLVGCLVGIACGGAIALGWSGIGFALLLLTGYLDLLDGTVARFSGRTSPLGCVLDIVSDRVVEWAVILGLYFAHPEVSPLVSLLMLGSVLLCVTSFLVVGIFTQNQTAKSFHYSAGLMERAEAFIFFGLMLLFPSLFYFLAILFSFLVVLTAIIRVYQFYKYN